MPNNVDKEKLVRRIDEIITIGSNTYQTRHEILRRDYVDIKSMHEFRSSSLSFIERVFGRDSSYFESFRESTRDGTLQDLDSGMGILNAIRSEIEGDWLCTVKGVITAEVFADFVEMAEHLLDAGYQDPAAVMCGGVLEEHLRQLCIKNGIEVVKGDKKVPHKADTLNAELAKNEVYSKLDQKSVTAWLDLRNKAAHGHYGEYTEDQVRNMLNAVTEFMARVAI
ncbi:MAG: hypothetical protein H6641_13745 [Caldilineaceae bacterium]|nr:hypothetical protein [Caldilineaceae bacterium]